MSETTIQLIVKGDSTETLVSIANRLNIWLCERPTTPPYPDGALLFCRRSIGFLATSIATSIIIDATSIATSIAGSIRVA